MHYRYHKFIGIAQITLNLKISFNGREPTIEFFSIECIIEVWDIILVSK